MSNVTGNIRLGIRGLARELCGSEQYLCSRQWKVMSLYGTEGKNQNIHTKRTRPCKGRVTVGRDAQIKNE